MCFLIKIFCGPHYVDHIPLFLVWRLLLYHILLEKIPKMLYNRYTRCNPYNFQVLPFLPHLTILRLVDTLFLQNMLKLHHFTFWQEKNVKGLIIFKTASHPPIKEACCDAVCEKQQVRPKISENPL